MKSRKDASESQFLGCQLEVQMGKANIRKEFTCKRNFKSIFERWHV